MTWTRISDNFSDRPDLLECSRSARLLHVEALVYANRHQLDGRIPTPALARFSDAPDLAADLAELERAGIWRQLHVGAWQIEGWEEREHQESSATVTKRREEYQKRQRRHRLHVDGDHSECSHLCKQKRDQTRDQTRDKRVNDNRDETRSQPTPSPPLPKGKGRGDGPRRCEHGEPISTDGEGCHQCVERPSLSVVQAPPADEAVKP